MNVAQLTKELAARTGAPEGSVMENVRSWASVLDSWGVGQAVVTAVTELPDWLAAEIRVEFDRAERYARDRAR